MSDNIHELMEKARQTGQLAAALAKAQAQMGAAKRTSENPFFRSHYADLAAIWDVIRKPLADNELAVAQLAEADGATVTVDTVLMHSSGEAIRSRLSLTAKDASPQAVGSAITYARRYGLSAICGVATEDDDAERAQGRTTAQKAPELPRTRKPAASKVEPRETRSDAPTEAPSAKYGPLTVQELKIGAKGAAIVTDKEDLLMPFATTSEEVVKVLTEANEAGVKVTLTAHEAKVGAKDVLLVTHAEEALPF